MNWADWVILVIIIASTLYSLNRGFMSEVLSLITWVSAFIVARVFFTALASLLEPYIIVNSMRMITAFMAIFIAILVVGILISKVIHSLIEATGLSSTDRILGIGFGAIRGGLIVVALVALIGMSPAKNDYWYKESKLIPHFVLLETWSKDMANDVIHFIWNTGR